MDLVISPANRKIKKDGKLCECYKKLGYGIFRNKLIEIENINNLKKGSNEKYNYNKEELEEMKILVPFKRKLQSEDRRLPYRKILKSNFLSIHRGQRKLLLSEIEFLTLYGNLSKYVIYAGAAPGIHTTYLSELFPKHKFFLYDPAPFAISETKNIKIFKEYFTDAIALDISTKFKNCLFICDIRRSADNFNDFENMVFEDLESQKKWHNIIKPEKSMLKFRIPYNKENINYFEGDIYYQAWAPVESAETRLIINKFPNDKIYKLKDYEEIMYRFNLSTRIQSYNNYNFSIKLPKGFDYCYDCTTEIYIIINYLKQNDINYKINNDCKIIDMVHEITCICNQPLNVNNHGKYINKSAYDKFMSL